MANFDAQRIHSGPADLCLYDSSNGYLFLGYTGKCEIKSKPVGHSLISGNLNHWKTQFKFSADLLQSDDTLRAAIIARRDTKQTIYIVGAHSMTTLENMYVAVVPGYEWESEGDAHRLILSAQTEIESDVNKNINLIGADGEFEVDTDTDGTADGWTLIQFPTDSIETSFLSGNCQRLVDTIDPDSGMYHDSIVPFQSSFKFTFSIYAYYQTAAGNAAVHLEILCYDFSDALVKTITGSSTNCAYHTSTRVQCSGVVNVSVPVKTVRARVIMEEANKTIDFDNAQLEIFGEATEFTAD